MYFILKENFYEKRIPRLTLGALKPLTIHIYFVIKFLNAILLNVQSFEDAAFSRSKGGKFDDNFHEDVSRTG